VNPFTPGFGVHPAALVGRDEVIARVERALVEANRPERWALLLGPRGCGKTVLLDRFQDAAAQVGWWLIQEDGRPGLVGRLRAALKGLFTEAVSPPRRRLTGVAGMGASAQWENTVAVDERDLRQLLAAVSELGGVYMTVDEIHRGRLDELDEIGQALQHCRRDGRAIGFAGAGLPGELMDQLLADTGSSFLGRCYDPELGELSDDAIRQGLALTAASAGRAFDTDALALAVDAIEGYPYLLQLVGYHAWDQDELARGISEADVLAGLPAARRDLARSVGSLAIKSVSAHDRLFLLAMARDDGPAKMAEIRNRLGINAQHANVYRDRLIQRRVILAVSHGYVDFSVPGLREHLRSIPQFRMPLTLGRPPKSLTASPDPSDVAHD
jgi:AAA ATPase domain